MACVQAAPGSATATASAQVSEFGAEIVDAPEAEIVPLQIDFCRRRPRSCPLAATSGCPPAASNTANHLSGRWQLVGGGASGWSRSRRAAWYRTRRSADARRYRRGRPRPALPARPVTRPSHVRGARVRGRSSRSQGCAAAGTGFVINGCCGCVVGCRGVGLQVSSRSSMAQALEPLSRPSRWRPASSKCCSWVQMCCTAVRASRRQRSSGELV